MNRDTVLDALQDSALAHAVSKSDHLVGAGLQVVHILGFVMLLAAVALVCLRLLGWVLPEQPLSRIAVEARRLFRIGIILAVASGTLIFISTARLYGHNWAFGLKAGLFLAALAVQWGLLRPMLRLEDPPVAAARIVVAMSLSLWFGVGFAGRMIGFV